ncbi:hypothetical protein ETQ85_20785 [Zoogloea oleivorans]|uniref:Uncharacterized protein n=1 Tax=Zoogloea oleivorans TaxID=1552750 RepID=A0A6C2CID5_9RHOO|nr:hypothetical protein ETQ85_20785 [Zoogloea oleivorans]
MHESAFPRKRGTTEPDVRFRAQTRMRKPSNPYMHGNGKAELWKSGKAQIRLSDSVGIHRCGFQ